MIQNLCSPALLYVVFTTTQIIIDIFKTMYNTAFLKFIVMILFTIVLNILCTRGLGVISWLIVFIPFIMMTIITSLLLYVFGLSPSTGKLDYTVDYPNDDSDEKNDKHNNERMHDKRDNERMHDKHDHNSDHKHKNSHKQDNLSYSQLDNN